MKTDSPNARTRTWLIVAAAALLVAGFLGVLAGNEFMEWRHRRAMTKRIEQARTGEASYLRPGDALPDVPVVGLDGTQTGLAALSRDQDMIILFISTDCEPCTKAVESWNKEWSGSGPPLVIGLCDNDVEYARVYANKTGFRFPLFCDSAHVLSEQHALDVFPSVIGVRQGGIVAYIQHGIGEGFTLDDAVESLGRSE